MSFVKLDAGILDSSLWAEDADVIIVFLTMLCMCDWRGLCPSTAPGIARRANRPLDRVRAALAVLEGPDLESRSVQEDGRRVRRVDGGYLLINYLKYRERDYTATERKRRQRARQRTAPEHMSRRDMRDRHAGSRSVTQAEAEVEAEKTKDSSEPQNAAPELASPVLMVFPTVGKVSSWLFTEAIRDQYGVLYPTLNTEASARRALHWLTTVKPTGKKTARGMHRFLTSWFDRAVAKGEDLVQGGNGKPQPGSSPLSPADLTALRRAREETGTRPGEGT